MSKYTDLAMKHHSHFKDLLRVNAENGGEKMPQCNAMIRECIGYVEETLREKGKL